MARKNQRNPCYLHVFMIFMIIHVIIEMLLPLYTKLSDTHTHVCVCMCMSLYVCVVVVV